MTDKLDTVLDLEEDTIHGKYLTFALDQQYYGIELKYVTEIIGIQAITEVPEVPDYIMGIINLRGKIIPVMDVRIRFKKIPIAYNDRTCIIIIDVQDMSVGLIIDAVSEAIAIADDQIIPPPQINKESQSHFIKAIGKVGNDVKLLLDCEKLLFDELA